MTRINLASEPTPPSTGVRLIGVDSAGGDVAYDPSGLATTTALTTGLASKADASATTSALAGKADATAVATALSTKADASALSAYATTSSVSSALSGKLDASARGATNGVASLVSGKHAASESLVPSVVGITGAITATQIKNAVTPLIAPADIGAADASSTTTALSARALTADVNTALATKADATATATALTGKADATSTTAALSGKAPLVQGIIPTSGQPANTVGTDGQAAWDYTTTTVYRRNGGVWDAGTSLKGIPGVDGDQQGYWDNGSAVVAEPTKLYYLPAHPSTYGITMGPYDVWHNTAVRKRADSFRGKNLDPVYLSTGQTWANGSIQLMQLDIPESGIGRALVFRPTAVAAGTYTTAQAAVYPFAGGAPLASCADSAVLAAFNATGSPVTQRVPLDGGTTVLPAGPVWVAIVTTGTPTTPVSILAGQSTTAGIINAADSTAKNSRFAQIAGTTLPSALDPATIIAQTSPRAWFVGIAAELSS